MILTCPSCRARYIVPDSAIGMEGRKVRCAQCRFSWFQDGPQPPEAAERVAPPPPPVAAPPPAVQPRPQPAREDSAAIDAPPELPPADWRGVAPEPEPVEEAPRTRYRRNPARIWTAVAVVAALLMVGALAAIYFVGPQQISAWMGGDQPAGDLLRFTRQNAAREPLPTDKELVTVTGEIMNASSQVQRVPQIRAEVTDAQQRVIYFWMIAPPARELQPGQSVTFSGASTDVPKGGRNVNLTFGPTT